MSKYGDFSSFFDKIMEDKFKNTSLTKMQNDNHRKQGNKGKSFGQLPRQDVFGFCKTF